MKVMIENKGPLPVAVGEQTILPGERTTLEGDVLMLEEVENEQATPDNEKRYVMGGVVRAPLADEGISSIVNYAKTTDGE